MGITNLNKFMSPFIVKTSNFPKIGSIVIDGGNMLYRISERAKKQYLKTYIGSFYPENTTIPKIPVKSFIDSVTEISIQLVQNEIVSFTSRCDNVFVIFDGTAQNSILGGYKNAEHNKRRQEVDGRIMKKMDPLGVTDAKLPIDLLNGIAELTNLAEPCQNIFNFIDVNFISNSNPTISSIVNYYTMIFVMENMFHVRNNLKNYVMSNDTFLHVTAIDSDDKEADWVMLKMANDQAISSKEPSLIVTTDTDMVLLSFRMKNVYIRHDVSTYKTPEYIDTNETWLRIAKAFKLSDLTEEFVIGIAMMLGNDFSGHKPSFAGCSFEEYVNYCISPLKITSDHPRAQFAKWLITNYSGDMSLLDLMVKYINDETGEEQLGTNSVRVFNYAIEYIYGQK